MSQSIDDDWFGPESRSWKPRLDLLLAKRRIGAAIRWLDRAGRDQQMHLFLPGSALQASRRVAWLYKINLLRTLRRYQEALAWTCLECEMYPENVAAQALKEELKRLLGYSGTDPARPATAHREPDSRWAGIAGMRELKAILERDVMLPMAQPELYARYRVPLPNGILLYGPPGCGKTHIARKLGSILGFRFMEVKPSDLGSIYVHGTQQKIGELFRKAREAAPCLLFLDELDASLPARSDRVGHHYSAEVNEFLTQLNKSSEQRVLVIGATNRLDTIDSAALRPGRFDKKIFVGQPDLEARVELLELYMKDRPQDAIDFVRLGRECVGYTCAEVEHIVNEAARRALDSQRAIRSDDLMGALAANPPSHADEKAQDDDSA